MSEQGFTISPWAFRDLTYMFSDPILVDQLLLTDEKQVCLLYTSPSPRD